MAAAAASGIFAIFCTPCVGAAAWNSTRTSKKGTCQAPWLHLANISYRLGRRMSFAEARMQLADCSQTARLLVDALDRMQLHLRENGVDTRTDVAASGRTIDVRPSDGDDS